MMWAVPALMALTTPFWSTLATASFEEAHTRSFGVSERVDSMVRVSSSPAFNVAFDLAKVIPCLSEAAGSVWVGVVSSSEGSVALTRFARYCRKERRLCGC